MASPSAQNATTTRPSPGLEQFFGSINHQTGLSLLDFARANQANIDFITGLGHRVYSEDFLAALDLVCPDGDQTPPDRLAHFLEAHLSFRDFDYDGALLWDSLQFCAPPLLGPVVDRLHSTLRPGSFLFAVFHADDRATSIPAHAFRIVDARTLTLSLRGHQQPGQPLNNRAIERMFERFASVKFFLTRENQREVLVRR